MSSFSSKRLAKNTLMMYFRMGISMIVGLISTRVVFNFLGVENYGLYGVVAGIIVLFSFISSALSTATQRYFSYEIGKGNYEKLKSIYNATLRIYGIVALVILFLAETVGLWFLNLQMVFPNGKIGLANFVYQVSVLITISDIFRVPYNAAVISSEKFEFYAYTSIIEAFVKLVVVFLLYIIPFESTKVYVLLLLLTSWIMLSWYFGYCKRHFSYIRFTKKVDKDMLKELISFSGWGFFGALCNMGYRQGVNVVINLFFGVVLNAAFGIANQVSALVNQFVTGFQSAYNPQITKTCATGTAKEQTDIVLLTSKISFSLLAIIGLSVIVNINYLLRLWLTDVPDKTVILCSLMIVAAIVDAIADPFWIVIFATGKIKTYQTLCAILMVVNVLLTIIAFKLKLSVEVSMYIRILMNIGVIAVRLIVASRITCISISRFIKEMVLKVVLICVLFITLYMMCKLVENEILRLFAATPLLVILCIIILVFMLFTKHERESFLNLIKSKII